MSGSQLKSVTKKLSFNNSFFASPTISSPTAQIKRSLAEVASKKKRIRRRKWSSRNKS